MPHGRRVQKGSFGSHFDELVVRFPAIQEPASASTPKRDPKLQEKIDIHALLFARAWEIERAASASLSRGAWKSWSGC